MGVSEEAPPRSGLAGGCALVVALLAAVIGLAIWLWSEIVAGDARPDGPPSSREQAVDTEPARETPPGGYLSRSERRELEVELERVEQDLAFARGQVQASPDVGTRSAWRTRVADLTAQRDALLAKLNR